MARQLAIVLTTVLVNQHKTAIANPPTCRDNRIMQTFLTFRREADSTIFERNDWMKKIIVTILAGLSISGASVGYASPINFNGDVSIKYERDTATGSVPDSGMMYTLKLRGEADLGSGWSLYARLGAQHATQPSLADYTLDAYGADKKSAVALDQFGLTYTTDNLAYKLGRQDATVGTTALLYSRPETNIGKKVFVDGFSISGTLGKTDITALLAQEDNAGSWENTVYALRGGYNPTKNLNWGLTLGHYQGSENGSTNHWAVDGTYKFGKSSLTAEYTKSSSSTDNNAYAATWNYGYDNKTTVYITGFRVETNGDMGKQSDFDNDNRGFRYGITHKFNDAKSLEVVYKNQKTVSGGQNNAKLEATFCQIF